MPGSRRGTAHLGEDVAIIGRSPALREVLRRVERVGPTGATVLILGERGTGKELVARALAAASPRRARPFIAVNCAALPPELLASELFGHERGAFTGATERRPGLLTAAHGGTVFLDEVGDLPPAGQAMLLRFLQEREVRPLGASTAHRVDVRVIAATNRELAGQTDERVPAFRADLYDRLSEVVITVPPLRERREDIAPLAEHFLALHAARHGLPRPQLDHRAFSLLNRHVWPGNVRELEKALSRAVIFSEDGWVQARHLELAGMQERLELVSHESDPHAGEDAEESARVQGPAVLGLTPRRHKILLMASETGFVCRRDVIEQFGVSRESARRELLALARSGLLSPEGRGRGSRYVLGKTDGV